MADPTTYSRIVLKMSSPYFREGGAYKTWTVKFNLSGAELTSQADAEATALDLAAPLLALGFTPSYLLGWLYYAPGSDVNKYQAVYEATDHPCTEAAYTGGGHPAQLEVIALCRCPVGVNSKGRAKYLMKHVHAVMSDGSGGTLSALASPATLLDKWNTGSGPESLVPVDPTTGVQGGPWTIETGLATRQLRRGQKKS